MAESSMISFAPELLDRIPIAIAIAHDASGTRVTVNSHFARLLGIRRGANASPGAPESEPPAYTVLRHGVAVAADELPMRTATRTNTAVADWRAEIVRADGTRIAIVGHAVPIRDAAGAAIGGLGLFFHESASQSATTDRQAYLADALRLAAIVESSDAPIIGKDLDGIVTSWNPAAERLFGYAAEEMIGRSIRTIIPPDRQREEDQVLEQLRSGKRIEGFETIRVGKDGRSIEVSLTVSPIRTPDGHIIGASKMVRDLTPLREYAIELERQVQQRTAELEAANARLEAFAFSVAHDLRAPLRGMHGLSRALLEDYGDRLDDVGRDYAARIVQEATSMDTLIRDLLAYGRLSHIDVPVAAIELRDVVDASVQALREEAADRGARIEIASDLPVVAGNRSLLLQVFTNLLSNAIKFGGPSPRVRIWAERRGEETAHVWVEDEGIGIAPEHQERIFGVFERLHGVEAYPGTGIGLAIVRKGVERLGGHAGVESEEGRGSRFWVELPTAEAA
jgi:PAS domain S-box-containing protein